ncbi:MAG: nickel-dependent hydrogenase large subunit, partial [Rhodomicrobium sp.]|nr:nickel-dependent hydrogenase large subunit [Rhodomicrobium sp.]
EPAAASSAATLGTGIAQVEAARGRLIHAVVLEDGRVEQYRILAPTEWNFHPDGAAARGLQRLASSQRKDLDAVARLFVTAVDPCVGYDVRIH